MNIFNIFELILTILFWTAVATVGAAFALAPGNSLRLSAGLLEIVGWAAPIVAIVAPLLVLPLVGAMDFDAEFCRDTAKVACFTLIPALVWAGFWLLEAEPAWLWALFWGEAVILVVLVAAAFSNPLKKAAKRK